MITAPVDPRLDLARRAVGVVGVVADPSLPPRLLRLVDTGGRHYLAKQHTQPDRYAHEVRAYLSWTRHLAGHVAELTAHDDNTHALLLTALPGDNAATVEPTPEDEEQLHRAAGSVLGALHRATSAGSTTGTGLAGRLRGWITRTEQAGLIDAQERRKLAHHADILESAVFETTACHLDYQPRNWLTGPDGFQVLDFEHSRRDARIRDFARLHFRHWLTTPRLRTAFFDGYSLPMTSADQRLLDTFGAIEAATALVRGHERHDSALSTHGRTVLAQLT
ncbi:aminoglycoside phosphotransferase family protein [Streptomyces acidiscabies]|uniref:aminoglycoside phosphotransferase family protein n=1 Tax=Streptomyces acidiscabies TaxID=42234 RepID=UPI000952BBE2|nr:aminoglycoside phosphotransferase family protein [Streptomyces acidiscabies]